MTIILTILQGLCAMISWKLLVVLVLQCSSTSLTSGQHSTCTRLTTVTVSEEYTVQVSYQNSYGCGSWMTCYSIGYRSQLRYRTRTVYHQEPGCCEGYHEAGEECLPTCPGCPRSHSCLAPDFCACPEYWTGSGCTEPPQNVALTATGPDKLEISWSPPPGSRATLYIVIFEGVTHPVQPSSNLVMELDSLTTFTRYTCCVAAKTISGASRMACDTQTTLELAPGDAPRNMNLKALNSTAIRIQWDPPLIPNGIIILYTVYINGNRRQKVNATGSTQSTAVGGFTPNKLLYVQLSASTSVGEGIKTGTERVTTLESVPGLVKNLRVVVKSEYILHVSWSPPTYTNGVLTGYTVVVTNLENPSDRILRRVAQNLHQLTIDRGIRPYVRYSVSVSASTRVGTGEPVEEIIYSQQGVPQSPPPNVTSSRTSATTANVKWDGIRWEDLRGWLVDYEIGYGSVMMSAYQKCRANGSYYTETMSVDSEGEYELTGLDPGLKYGVRLAGRTSAGAGPFSHTHVPWYINTIFTVTLEIENCTEWIAIKPAQLAEELAETFSTGIKLTCNCFFPSIYIADEQVMCHNKGLHLVFTGRIISTQVRDSSNLFEDLQMWLSRVLTVTVRDKELKIEKNESGSLIETNPGNECDEPPSDISHGSIIGGSVGGVLSVLLTVVVLIVAAVAVWQKHRSKSSVKCKPDSFLDDKTSRSAPLQKHISTELLSLGKQPPKTPPKPPPIKPLLPPQTPPKPAKKPLKPPKISPKPLKPPPRPLQVFPKHLITTPQPQKLPFKPIKIPLMPPKNRPTPQKDKQTKKFANKFRLPRQYELPVSQNHNVYKDPDIMEEKGGTTSLRNVAYEEAGSGTRAEKEEELYYPAIM